MRIPTDTGDRLLQLLRITAANTGQDEARDSMSQPVRHNDDSVSRRIGLRRILWYAYNVYWLMAVLEESFIRLIDGLSDAWIAGKRAVLLHMF